MTGRFVIHDFVGSTDLPDIAVGELDDFLDGSGWRVLQAFENGEPIGVYIVSYEEAEE